MKDATPSSCNGPWTRRRVIAALAAGCTGMMFPLGGCLDSEKPIKSVGLWHIWPTEDGQPIREVLQNYSSSHPDINLQAQSVSTNNLKAKLIGAARTDSLPEVFVLNSAWVKEPQLRDSVVDLLPLAEADRIDPRRVLRSWDYERCKQGPSMYCLPANSATGSSMLFVNCERLAQVGIREVPRLNNWEEFTLASQEYVRRANPNGELEIIALDPFMGPGMVIHSSLANGVGAPSISPDGRKSQMNTPGSLRVAKAMDDYINRVYGFFGGYRAILEWRFRFAGQHRQPAFSSLPYEKQIFAIAAAGSLARYRRFLSMRNLMVQPVPGLDRLHGGMASHTWSYALSKRAKENEEAWRLLRYLTLQDDGVGRFARLYGRPSPLAESQDSAYYQEWGRVWDGVKEAAALDTAYSASSEDEFLRYHLFLVPLRRLRGESIEMIFADLDAQYQAYLDSNQAQA